eukprot:GEMP01109880.1.p1 GENE.GEMP01109880.1~~GEMP01109880.1.p1  ORF type:complete len:188 (+),score=67.08 GEMP01109880.1:65-628(+)
MVSEADLKEAAESKLAGPEIPVAKNALWKKLQEAEERAMRELGVKIKAKEDDEFALAKKRAAHFLQEQNHIAAVELECSLKEKERRETHDLHMRLTTLEETLMRDLHDRIAKYEEEHRALVDIRMEEKEAKLEAAVLRRLESKKAQVEFEMEGLDRARKKAMEILIKANRLRAPFDPSRYDNECAGI